MKHVQYKLVALLLLGGVYAQEGTLKVGAVLLPQNTWLLNQDDSDAGPELDYEVTWGFAGGLSLAYNFSDYVGVGLDVLYSRQGQKYKGVENGTNLTATTSLNYLKLPLLLRLGSDPESPVQFSFFVGPQANLLLSYHDKVEGVSALGRGNMEVSGTTMKSTYTIGGVTITEEEKLSASAYKSFTLGAAVGLGVGFKVSDELFLTLHFRGDYAFGDAENKDARISYGNHDHPYWEQKPKYYFGYHGSSQSERPATSALTGGLMLGVYYNLPLR
ncbi:MAG: outer membrane beta-barrel protein [Bacteroidia bacterium]|nr:outer membrane beta-barrel protein [Bacteroidia bacterium]